MTPQMMIQLNDIVGVLEKDQSFKAVVVQGQGGSFCTGMDVTYKEMLTKESGYHMNIVMTDTLTRLNNLPQVTVADIQRYAIGGGAELAVATDFRVMAPGSFIRFVQLKMGVTPGWKGAYHLSQLLGRRQALQLLLTSEKVSDQQALSMGLVDSVTDNYQQFLDTLTQYPLDLTRSTKLAINSPDRESGLFQSLWGSQK